MATAKKAASKKASSKKGSSKKKGSVKGVAKKTVAGRKVTAELKQKGSAKRFKGCVRLDVGGGKVVDLCVSKTTKKKGPKIPAISQEEFDADRERLMSRASDGIPMARRRRRRR